MLMADMTEDERLTMRELYAPALPGGAELIETADGLGMVRLPDGTAHLVALHWGLVRNPEDALAPEDLERRAEAYRRLADDLRRMAAIARAAFGAGGMEKDYDQLMREIYLEMDEIGSLGDGEDPGSEAKGDV